MSPQNGAAPVDNFEFLRKGKMGQLGNANKQGVLDEWISREDLAEQLALTTDTLARWATQHIGPPRIKVGRRVFYRKSSVEKWLKGREMGGDSR